MVELASSNFFRSSGVCSDSLKAFLSLATTGAGMLAGPMSIHQVPMLTPLSFGCSAKAGMSGVT